jgi:hypothetical protein
MTTKKKILPATEREEILIVLEARFAGNPGRHDGIKWADVAARLSPQSDKLWSLNEMERTGGEPDVIGFDKTTGEYVFVDCSPENPKGRRSLCYDRAAWESRKEHKPVSSAIESAAEMGISILNEEEYRALQKFGRFDTKTSSWLETPADIRESGGAIFGDWRYGRVFVYHNGAESYYAARGFRGSLRV